jgi:hypothetical protein
MLSLLVSYRVIKSCTYQSVVFIKNDITVQNVVSKKKTLQCFIDEVKSRLFCTIEKTLVKHDLDTIKI